MNRDEAKAKIAKLMAMGTCEGANENEAEAALRQASFLMKKHAIEQAELADARGSAQVFEWSAVNVPVDPIKGSKTAVGWLGSLAVYIAEFTDTKASYKDVAGYGKCICIEGEWSDVEYAVYLTKHLRDTVRRMSAEYMGARSRSDREEYRRGMVQKLSERMKALREETDAELGEIATSCGTALVIVDRKIAERNRRFGAPKYGTSRSAAGNDYARSAGARDGERVGFGRPVGGSTKRAITGG